MAVQQLVFWAPRWHPFWAGGVRCPKIMDITCPKEIGAASENWAVPWIYANLNVGLVVEFISYQWENIFHAHLPCMLIYYAPFDNLTQPWKIMEHANVSQKNMYKWVIHGLFIVPKRTSLVKQLATRKCSNKQRSFLMLHFFSVVVLLIFLWEVDLSGINNWDANTLYAAGFLDLDELRHWDAWVP